ncbi:MAG: hypothetical protein ACLVLA_11575 [Acidaminococcus intestini]
MIHAAGYDLYGKAAFLGIVLLVAAASLVFWIAPYPMHSLCL